MAGAKSPAGRDFLEFQVDVGNIKYQIDAMVKQGERQEKKIDALKESLDALSTVSRHEFDDYKDSMNVRLEAFDNRYVRLESIRGLRSIGYAVATALAIAVVLALLRLTGAKL